MSKKQVTLKDHHGSTIVVEHRFTWVEKYTYDGNLIRTLKPLGWFYLDTEDEVQKYYWSLLGQAIVGTSIGDHVVVKIDDFS